MKNFSRLLILPITALLLAGTAFFEWLSPEPDWAYWKDFNEHVFKMLPFSDE